MPPQQNRLCPGSKSEKLKWPQVFRQRDDAVNEAFQRASGTSLQVCCRSSGGHSCPPSPGPFKSTLVLLPLSPASASPSADSAIWLCDAAEGSESIPSCGDCLLVPLEPVFQLLNHTQLISWYLRLFFSSSAFRPRLLPNRIPAESNSTAISTICWIGRPRKRKGRAMSSSTSGQLTD